MDNEFSKRLPAEIAAQIAALSPEKRALFELRLKQKKRAESTDLSIPRSKKSSTIPLSFAQQRLWFLDRLLPDSAFYNMPEAYRVKGPLDIEALKKSFNEIVRRHETLRTIFIDEQGETLPRVIPTAPLELPVIDLQDFPAAEKDAEIIPLIDETACRSFNLAKGPLFSVKLLRLGQADHVLLVVMHHIITDGWSMEVFFHELALLYEAYSNGQNSPLPELPVQYADYAVWQRQLLQGKILEKQLSYWKEQLDGLGVLELPIDRLRPPVQTYRGSRASFAISHPLTEALAALSRAEQVTLFMALLAAFQTLLYRYTGQEDITVGSPIANRNRAEIEELIGFFVNTLVLRTDLAGDPTFRDLLQRVRKTALEAYAHQDLPFEKLVEELQPERNSSFSPLFQVMFVLQNTPGEKLQLPGLTTEPIAVETGTAKFDLTLTLTEMDGELQGIWEYNTDLFDRSTITRMTGHFQTILEGISANPDKNISKLPLLTAPEEHQLLVEFHQTDQTFTADICLHQMFEKQVVTRPDAIALVCGDQKPLTYRDLNTRANQVAHYLLQEGVGPETLVGLCMERTADLVIGLLGILKTGAAYVPLDPGYPTERLAFMLEDARVAIILTQAHLADQLGGRAAHLVCLDTMDLVLARQHDTNPETAVKPENLAYVLYTSGSTGKPKGVMIDHANVVRLFTSTRGWFQFDEQDVWTLFHSYAFDFSVWELWGALLYGGRLVVVPHSVSQSPEEFYALLDSEKVTVLNQTPSAFRQLVQHEEQTPNIRELSLRWIIFGGEALDLPSLKPWFDRHGDRTPQLVNMYGITETTVHVTYRPLTIADLEYAGSPVGIPIPDLQVYILDQNLQPVPVGVPGEMLIGGAGLGRGYLNRPSLTAQQFIPNPFSNRPGSRLYRSGDLGCYQPDGEIKYLGRLDHQVKIRGFRIELGEIESVLRQHEAVRESVVVMQKEDTGDRRLVAYAVCGASEAPTTPELRRFLGEKLPGYMVPAQFVFLDALPLTPNGKVDMRALPTPDRHRPDMDMFPVAPRTPIEKTLAQIWTGVLGIEQLGVHDNFFELGGHSLLATQVISQARQIFEVDLPLRYLFEEPTVAGLAKHIQVCLHSELPKTASIEMVPRDGDLQLSFAQQRLWFLDRLIPDSALYNVPEVYRVAGPLAIEPFHKSLNEIARRHEVLRTIFVDQQGETVQKIMPAAHLDLPVINLQDFPDGEKEAEINRLIDEAACHPFDLTKGPLFSVKLLRLSQADHVLLVVMHHIITDGWSTGLFFRELALLYEAYSNGRASPLPELPVQYADYAVWQRQLLQGDGLERLLSYWKEQLNGLGVLELPIDRLRPPMQTYRGSRASFAVSQPLTEALAALGRAEQVTLFMTLLAAFQALLYRYTGQQDIAVGSPIAGRNRAEIEDLIGFFVNTMVLRTDLAGDPTFRDLLQRVRKTALDAYAHQDLPFEKLVEELQPERNPSFSPLFQVMFDLQNAPGEKLLLPGLGTEALAVETGTAKFDLTLTLAEKENELQGTWEYNTDLFDQSTITRMTGHFQTLLGGIIANPDQRISELGLLTAAEEQQLLVEWNATGVDYPKEACVHELFEAQVEKTPDAVAVVFADRQLTYCELNDRANRLAHYLQKLGVGPDILVGLCLERSLEMVVGMLGTLKAGGAYVPLDPAYPKERLGFMIAESRAPLLLIQHRLQNIFPDIPARIICLDAEWPVIKQENNENISTPVSSDNLAYVMFTSGSTGMPKQVGIMHQSLCNHMVWIDGNYSISPDDPVLQRTPFSFDASVWEFYAPLMVGGRLIMAKPMRQPDSNHLINDIIAHNVTILQVGPSLLRVLLDDPNFSKCRSLRHIFCGGELLTNKLQNRLLALLPQVLLHNLYGPTEATIDALSWTCLKVSPDNSVPIGRPIYNTRAYIVDSTMHPVPIGVKGELLIGGDCLARGYLKRPDLTKEKFIPDPFSNEPGARLYRTGDLARYLPDGNIEFLGRLDHQVKIRGFRIELGEVEAVLSLHPAVSDNVVVVQEEDSGDKRLVAYVVPNSGGATTVNELRRFLSEKLPGYMIPSIFIFLDALPLTPNGKVDRSALPALENSRPELEERYLAPHTPTEQALVEIWSEILGIKKLGVHDNFFDLGGDSLLAIKVVSRTYAKMNVEIPLRVVFEQPTVALQAEYLEDIHKTMNKIEPVTTPPTEGREEFIF